MSWRKIAKHLVANGHPITFQRVCQLYARVKRQTGVVKKVKQKEVAKTVKLKYGKQLRTQDLTPETLDEITKLDSKSENSVVELRRRRQGNDKAGGPGGA